MVKNICSKCKQEKPIVSMDAFSSYQLCEECNNLRTELERIAFANRIISQNKVDKFKARTLELKDNKREMLRGLYEYNQKVILIIDKLLKESEERMKGVRA